MMQFMHSLPSGRSLALAPRGAAILLAALAGGCSAEISRFDFPTFSLTGEKQNETASLQSSNRSSGDRQTAANGYGGYDRGGYTAPRDNRDSGVAVANLPDASPSAPSYNYQDDRRRRAGLETTSRPAPSALRPGESLEVRPGDTLYNLSMRHQVSVADLMEVNQLNNPNLRPGQRIYLPEGYAVQQRPVAAAPATERAPVHIPPAVEGRYQGAHTMRNGESLYGIARSHGVTVAELQEVNGITDPRALRVGTVLKVPGSAGGSTAVAAAEPVAETPATRVADAPVVVQTTHVPTVINRRETQVAGLGAGGEVSTGAIDRAPERGKSSSDKLRWPVQGKILTGFGQRSDGTHNDGINLSVPQGTSVHAAEEGTVAYAGSELKGYGNLILVRHDNGWVTAYAHADQLLVQRGDKVQRGQVIAKAGRTGSVDQPQLHFELRQGSKPVDPVPFLERL